ncbi:sensor domain-containing diguanylate cyclase [Bacillota bacterium Lsc_1132]
MVVNQKTKNAIFLAWLFLVPLGMWLTFHAYPPHISGHAPAVAAFFLLTSIVAAMPLVINNTPIFLIQWVSLASFLLFGLFVEMAFAQAAVIVLLVKIRLEKDQFFRYPMNSIMFFLVSLVSGMAYYALGGETGNDLVDGSRSLWLAALYAILSYLLNQIIISFYFSFIYKNKGSYFGKAFIWETVTTVITFPLGFVLYMLYVQVGVAALLFVGVPFASLSIILNLYYSSEKVNKYLQMASEIGHQLASRLFVKDVIDLFIQKLTEMLPVDYAYIFDAAEDRELKVIRRLEKGKVLPNDLPPLRKSEGVSGIVWSKRRASLFTNKKAWKGSIADYIPDDAESVLSVPIVRNNEVVGVLLLASKKKRAYEKSQLMIVDLLCSHFAVAIDNARHYEEAKTNSERCALTHLYNYRFFENMLTNEFEKLYVFERKRLSLIILDIDHFKAINDTFGHQSGNEILCKLANRLTVLIGNKGTVARYGGEEFVVLLPEVYKEDAFELAEQIRKAIADQPFTITHSINEDEQKMLIPITVSIGVATAPEDADDALALIRHADRALYVGAKRAGRNRVAGYTE